MPQVSLTTFVDYVASNGTPRLTKLRKAHEQYEEGYSPATDFYRPLRQRIIANFESGWDPSAFDKSVAEVTDAKKQGVYETCRKGVRKWAGVTGKKSYKWLTPTAAVWSSGTGLDVNVRPELWVAIDGVDHVIKLYFKTDPLSAQKARLSLRLLEKTVGSHGKVGILDVQRGRLITQGVADPADIDLLLAAEAAGFVHLWTALGGV